MTSAQDPFTRLAGEVTPSDHDIRILQGKIREADKELEASYKNMEGWLDTVANWCE